MSNENDNMKITKMINECEGIIPKTPEAIESIEYAIDVLEKN